MSKWLTSAAGGLKGKGFQVKTLPLQCQTDCLGGQGSTPATAENVFTTGKTSTNYLRQELFRSVAQKVRFDSGTRIINMALVCADWIGLSCDVLLPSARRLLGLSLLQGSTSRRGVSRSINDHSL